MSAEIVQRIALYLPALMLSLSVHEFAHAWVATRLGDPTPTRQGRLTLSPVSHIDPIGSLIFPVLMLATTGGVFGWARPVEFNPANFNRKWSARTGAALAAAAGPLSNLFLALIAIVAFRFAVIGGVALPPPTPRKMAGMLFGFLEGMFHLNVLLAVFNFVPLPPLDGSYLLPRSMDHVREWLSRYSFILFMALFFLPIPGLGGTLGGFLLRPFLRVLTELLQTIAFWGL